uniref:Uncharacterized protein n=1 Tax=Knipowitschia caucasica TaxID=637954 RepID=A0AAV2J5N3_KNICA
MWISTIGVQRGLTASQRSPEAVFLVGTDLDNSQTQKTHYCRCSSRGTSSPRHDKQLKALRVATWGPIRDRRKLQLGGVCSPTSACAQLRVPEIRVKRLRRSAVDVGPR